MAKPDNSIAKIKLPGENTQRPIVPYGLTDGTSYATVPAMNADSSIIVSEPNEEQVINNYPLILSKYLSIYSDDIENLDNPYDYSDPDITIYSTKILLTDNNGNDYDYYFPNRSGLFVVRTGTGSGASYSESALLATSIEPGADGHDESNIATPKGFRHNWAGTYPILRGVAYFNFPEVQTNAQTPYILGLQIDIVDLTLE